MKEKLRHGGLNEKFQHMLAEIPEGGNKKWIRGNR